MALFATGCSTARIQDFIHDILFLSMRRPFLLLLILLFGVDIAARQASYTSFAPFEKFRQAVLAGDSSALSELYTKIPEPQTTDADNRAISMQDELNFWTSWKTKGLTDIGVEAVGEHDPSPDLHILILRLDFITKNGFTEKKQFINVAQGWSHQNGQWLLSFSRHSAPTLLRQPLEDKLIYKPTADPSEQIADAVKSASASHRRILLVFGGNWCFDCHVLDEAFHSPEIAPTLDKSFLVVHIDIGQMDKNLDVAKKYDIPLDRGVPAIAVLDSDGKLLFSQKRGEFEAARSMSPDDILAFLDKWKPST
jgi:thioredoxin-related protein